METEERDPLGFRSQELVLFLTERLEAGGDYVPRAVLVRIVQSQFGDRWAADTIRRTLDDMALYGILARDKGRPPNYRITALGVGWLRGVFPEWPWSRRLNSWVI